MVNNTVGNTSKAIKVFARQWLKHPTRIGALVPSGTALADLITREVYPQCAPVVELGPGTGVFTAALINKGIPEEKLYLVESNPEFAELLKLKFPTATVLETDAARIRQNLLLRDQKVGAIVSGLPLLSMHGRSVMGVLLSAQNILRKDAPLFQFTYGLRNSVPDKILQRVGIRSERIGTAFCNLPPASVYRYTFRSF